MKQLKGDAQQGKITMDESQKHSEFYTVFMHRSREGIWRADLDVPLSIDMPEEQQLEHLSRHAIVRDCNLVFARMYGYDSIYSIIGLPLLAFLNMTDKTNIQTLQMFLKSGYCVRDAETYEVDKDGNPRWFLNNVETIIENKQLVRLYGVQEEITQRKLVERARTSLQEKLPPRQWTILRLSADGLSMKEVAGVLHISEKTAHTHRARLVEKLGFQDARSLLRLALQLGIGKGELTNDTAPPFPEIRYPKRFPGNHLRLVRKIPT